ncbi:uncharacterized protein AMSG_05445 [Thecamonas trahens ATCC 50062]|uniref:DUF7789 domain-containing protein n=1 Tax=Thecamonas trahens ATCC 50062 TaxID=461836 RepID=A0A0L0DDQ3_THETB|nr:hypothetical protein AMSG_05445 [Thecamonas trahens ATCC 50062]KNC49438.1 hypothetical protein AMSG_05445 [Thecamonas trahens ATCC 50062]|eukprot:XP_013757860.1 hypothetical protein AMSG_05445 [Thecamonas trahens ATCC 50062]
MISKVAKMFLMVVALAALTVAVFQVLRLNSALKSSTSDNDRDVGVLYGSLLLFSLLFYVYFAADGVLNENFIQVLAFMAFAALFTFYVVYQVVEESSAAAIVQLVVVAVADIVLAGLAYKLYLIFGWQVYKRIGSDRAIRSAYKTYQIALALLKIDFQFQIVLVALNLVLILDVDDPEFYVNVAAIPLIIAAVVVAVLGLRHENKPATLIFVVLAALEPSYIVFRVYRLLTRSKYSGLPRPQLVAMAVIAVLLRYVFLAVIAVAYSNFGSGLREQLSSFGMSAGSGSRASSGRGGSGPGPAAGGKFEDRRMTVV